MAITQLTENQFNHTLETKPFMLVDFSAKWCEPCKGFSKVMETVSSEYPDCFFATIDVDEEKSLAKEFSVQSVPSVLVIRNRHIVFARSGAMTATELRQLLNDAKALVF